MNGREVTLRKARMVLRIGVRSEKDKSLFHWNCFALLHVQLNFRLCGLLLRWQCVRSCMRRVVWADAGRSSLAWRLLLPDGLEIVF